MADVYVFLGPPGAGKGTLGDVFCEKTGVVHVSTGQLLRDEMAAGTALGAQVKAANAEAALAAGAAGAAEAVLDGGAVGGATGGGSNALGPDGKPLYQQPVRNPNKSKRKKKR